MFVSHEKQNKLIHSQEFYDILGIFHIFLGARFSMVVNDYYENPSLRIPNPRAMAIGFVP